MNLWLMGCRIKVSPLFFALIAMLLLIDRTGMMPHVLCAIAVHEAGHLIVMRRFGIKPLEIALRPFEINIQKSVVCGSPREDLWVSLAGIAANFLCVLLAAAIWIIFSWGWALQWGVCNFVLGTFEALPIAGLDGYRALYCIGCLRHDPRPRMRLIFLSYFTLALLIIASSIVIWEIGNPLPLLFCLYMGLLLPYHKER